MASIVIVNHYSYISTTLSLAPGWVNPTQCLALDFDLKSGILDTLATLTVFIQVSRCGVKIDSAEIHICHGLDRKIN